MSYPARHGYTFHPEEAVIEAYGSTATIYVWTLRTPQAAYTVTPLIREIQHVGGKRGIPVAWAVADPGGQDWWIVMSLDEAADRIATLEANKTPAP